MSPEGHQLFWTEPNAPFDKAQLNQQILDDAIDAIEETSIHQPLLQRDPIPIARLVLVSLAEIAKRYGNQGMAGSPIKLYLDGTAGQSFAVWNAGDSSCI